MNNYAKSVTLYLFVITLFFTLYSCAEQVPGHFNFPRFNTTVSKTQIANANALFCGYYVYVAAGPRNTIFRVNPSTLETNLVAGQDKVAGFKDGPALQGLLNNPTAITGSNLLLPTSPVFIAEPNNNAIRLLLNGILESITVNNMHTAASMTYLSDPPALAIVDKNEIKLISLGVTNANCNNAINLGKLTSTTSDSNSNALHSTFNSFFGSSATFVCKNRLHDSNKGGWFSFIGNGHKTLATTCTTETNPLALTQIFVVKAGINECSASCQAFASSDDLFPNTFAQPTCSGTFTNYGVSFCSENNVKYNIWVAASESISGLPLNKEQSNIGLSIIDQGVSSKCNATETNIVEQQHMKNTSSSKIIIPKESIIQQKQTVTAVTIATIDGASSITSANNTLLVTSTSQNKIFAINQFRKQLIPLPATVSIFAGDGRDKSTNGNFSSNTTSNVSFSKPISFDAAFTELFLFDVQSNTIGVVVDSGSSQLRHLAATATNQYKISTWKTLHNPTAACIRPQYQDLTPLAAQGSSFVIENNSVISVTKVTIPNDSCDNSMHLGKLNQSIVVNGTTYFSSPTPTVIGFRGIYSYCTGVAWYSFVGSGLQAGISVDDFLDYEIRLYRGSAHSSSCSQKVGVYFGPDTILKVCTAKDVVYYLAVCGYRPDKNFSFKLFNNGSCPYNCATDKSCGLDYGGFCVENECKQGTTCLAGSCLPYATNAQCVGATSLLLNNEVVGNSIGISTLHGDYGQNSCLGYGNGKLKGALWYSIVGNNKSLLASTCSSITKRDAYLFVSSTLQPGNTGCDKSNFNCIASMADVYCPNNPDAEVGSSVCFYGLKDVTYFITVVSETPATRFGLTISESACDVTLTPSERVNIPNPL